MRTLKECDALQHISNSEEVKNVNRQLIKAIKFTIWNNRQGICRFKWSGEKGSILRHSFYVI